MYFHISGTNVRLLGTMHMLPTSAPDLPPWVSDAYEWSQTVVLETDTSTLLPFFVAPGTSTLRKALKPAVWSTLESIWPSDGPLSPLVAVHPWAALLLAPSFCLEVSSGVEPHFTQWATEHSKPIRFLETAKQFAPILETVPKEEVLAGLDLFASDLEAPQRSLKQIHTAWLAEDLEGIYLAASLNPTFAYPGLRGAILESRNRLWAPVINSMLSTNERTLIAVGALHFYGPDNLFQLLGRGIERIKQLANPSIERPRPGKPGRASHVKRRRQS